MSLLISRFVLLVANNAFPFYSLFPPLILFSILFLSLLLNLSARASSRVRALSAERSLAPLRASFRSIFSCFCHFASISSINHYTFTQPARLRLVFSPQTVISGRLSRLFSWQPSVSTCPLPYLLFQSRALYRSFPHSSAARLLCSQFSGSSSSFRRVLNLNLIPHFSFHLGELKTA